MNKTHEEFMKEAADANSLPAQTQRALGPESEEDIAMYADESHTHPLNNNSHEGCTPSPTTGGKQESPQQKKSGQIENSKRQYK